MNLTNSVTAATGVDQVQRVLVVRDKQPNGAALTFLGVLNSVSTTALTNMANSSRFDVLLDRAFPLNASAEPGSIRRWMVELPLGFRQSFNLGVAGTVADIVTNSLYLMLVGSEAAGVTAGSMAYTSRVLFTDE